MRPMTAAKFESVRAHDVHNPAFYESVALALEEREELLEVRELLLAAALKERDRFMETLGTIHNEIDKVYGIAFWLKELYRTEIDEQRPNCQEVAPPTSPAENQGLTDEP